MVRNDKRFLMGDLRALLEPDTKSLTLGIYYPLTEVLITDNAGRGIRLTLDEMVADHGKLPTE
jgi:hypothetical protein